MAEETNKIISDIFSEVNKTISVVGFAKVIQSLKILRTSRLDLTEDQLEKSKAIISLVCQEYEIKYDEIFSHKRNNDRRKAIGTCAFFIEKELAIDNYNIAFILKKLPSAISTYKSEITQLNEKHPSDIKFIQILNNIKLKLKNQK